MKCIEDMIIGPVEVNKPVVKFKKLDPRATIPTYAHDGDSGMDLRALDDVTFDAPGDTWIVDTGLSVEIPPGYEGQVRSRSGLASSLGVFVLNSPGTIDCTYRGEIKVILAVHGRCPVHIVPCSRIAQLVIAPVASAEIVEVQELSETERGASGLGSTGK